MVSAHPWHSIIHLKRTWKQFFSLLLLLLQFPCCPASSRLLYPMLLAISMLQLQFQFPFWDFFQRRMHTRPNLITKNDLEFMIGDFPGILLFWLQCSMCGILYQDTFLLWNAWSWSLERVSWLLVFLVICSFLPSTSQQNMEIRDGWSC